jgi:hypothetical protein
LLLGSSGGFHRLNYGYLIAVVMGLNHRSDDDYGGVKKKKILVLSRQSIHPES